MARRPVRLVARTAVAIGLAIAIGVAGWLWLGDGTPVRTAERPSPAPGGGATPPSPPAASLPPTPTPPPARPAPPGQEDTAAAAADPFEGEAAQQLWASVDLEKIRAELPDNLYWTMAAPTKDPEVERARQAERDRWNVEYGKVLSNTATPEEIDAYYAYRQKLSSDYVAFASHLLMKYGMQIPKRDVGLLKLAIDMHLARLEEIPRQIAEAHERQVAHDAARRAWLEEEQALGTPPAATDR